MAKGKKKEKAAAGKKKSSQNPMLAYFGALLIAVVFVATTLLLSIAMLPTFVVFVLNRRRAKIKVVTVGAMNLAGSMPFIIELWGNGNNFDVALSIVTDPKAIIVMYAAAAVGYLIDWAMTGIVASVLHQQGLNRKKEILKLQESLVERWGDGVTGDYDLDEDGFIIGRGDE